MNRFIGVGVGLRRNHFNDVLESKHSVDWFEVISENFIDFGGRPKNVLDMVSKQFPVIPHGLSLSVASGEKLDKKYIESLKNFLNEYNPPWFSDHLCISSYKNVYYHDLIPPLRTNESVKIISDKIKRIQDYFGRPFAIENVSTYVDSSLNTMSEVEFINNIIDKTDVHLLLDINNVYVNSKNHYFDPYKFLDAINLNKVIQIHLAGHLDKNDIIIDTHGDFISDEVWDLYEYMLKKADRKISTLIEWDHSLPTFKELTTEVDLAKEIMNKVFKIKNIDKEVINELTGI